MQWITREHVTVDRVACPWLIRKFVDPAAVVDGDFAVTEAELQPVLKALRHADIQIVAIHQHMSGEEPRIMFLHYWGVGHAEDLTHRLRAALDQTHSK